MSYTRQLLYSIADEMGRNRRDMDAFISVLQKNWFDSRQSLKSLTMKDFDKFQIPGRLSMIIMQKVGSNSTQPKTSNHPQMMDIEENSIKSDIESLKRKASSQIFGESINTLIELFRNIRSNLTNQKFRMLKKSNKRISKLISIPENSKIMYYGGFREEGQFFVMKNINLSLLDQCLDILAKYQQGPKFNPYEVSIMSTIKNQPKIQGQSSVIYNDKLKQLQEERLMIMSKPIKDRKIKIYQEKKDEIKPDRSWYDERDPTMQERQFNESIKEKLKHYGQDAKFMNKRKQEYFQLAKKPVFSETIVKVKLPDNWIFQCRFSPMETLETLVRIFDEFVQNKKLSYYLYMTPPVKKLSGLVLRETFYDSGNVPRAIFYLGSQETIKGNIMKGKNNSFLNNIFN